LGLISMRERAHLVNGVFSIESKLNRGTRIFVRVPLVPAEKTPSTLPLVSKAAD
jgi:nitrate/nitrite-specific signal transduction histidine kinase